MDKSYFDHHFDRKSSMCIKYDELDKKFGRSDIMPAWVADMDLPTAPCVAKALQDRASHPIYGYTTLDDRIKEVVKNWQYKRHKFSIKKSEIEFCYGVVPSIYMLISAFTLEGDGVVLQPPVYQPFFQAIKNNRRVVLRNPLKESKRGFEIDVKGFEKIAKDGAKMLLLCNPHNPIGIAHSKEVLKDIGEIASESNMLIISDEIHADITYSKKHTPIAMISPSIGKITITLNSPAKSFNTPGINLSYLIFKDKSLKQKFQQLKKERGVENFNLFSIESLLASYRDGEEYILYLNSYLSENIEIAVEFLRTFTPKIKPITPQATYLIWLDFRELFLFDDKRIFRFLVDEAKVGLNMGIEYGEEGSGFARLNIAMPKVTLLKLLERIKVAYEGL